MNPKMPSQSKGNISYYCLYDCHSNGKNIHAKFPEKILNHSQKWEIYPKSSWKYSK